MNDRGFLIGQFALIPHFGKAIGQIVAFENSREDGSCMPTLEFGYRLRITAHLNNCVILNDREEKLFRMLHD